MTKFNKAFCRPIVAQNSGVTWSLKLELSLSISPPVLTLKLTSIHKFNKSSKILITRPSKILITRP